MNKYKVLIIGTGKQGVGEGQEKVEGKIINFAHAFVEHHGFDNNILFYDKDFEKAKNAASIWDGRWLKLNKFDSCVLHAEEIDIAVVSTNDGSHYEILKRLAEYPLKLVLCEKPLCETIEQAKEIVQLYKDRGINLAVNYTRRYLPYYNYLKQYGKPVYATCAFNRGFLHSGSHGIDFFNMIGAENYRLIEIPTEAYRVWDLKVYYEKHVFSEVRVGDMPVWKYYDKSHWHIVDNIYKFLEGEEPLKCKGEDALRALEICFELMKEISLPWHCICGNDLSNFDKWENLSNTIICDKCSKSYVICYAENYNGDYLELIDKEMF